MVVCKGWEHSLVAERVPDAYEALDFTPALEIENVELK